MFVSLEKDGRKFLGVAQDDWLGEFPLRLRRIRCFGCQECTLAGERLATQRSNNIRPINMRPNNMIA